MEIYVVVDEDGEPMQASEDFDRLARWVKQRAEDAFKDYEDEENAELDVDGLEASITVDGETQWELTYKTVNLL